LDFNQLTLTEYQALRTHLAYSSENYLKKHTKS